jgi:hypothetical protein
MYLMLPKHIMDLANSVVITKCESILHDALLEIGLPMTAKHFSQNDKAPVYLKHIWNGSYDGSCSIALVLAGKRSITSIDDWKNIYKELCAYVYTQRRLTLPTK